MSVKFQITFDDNYYGIYYAGQMITGRVELTLDKIKKVKGLSLKISGFAKCQWNEHERDLSHGKRRNRSVCYEGRDDYLSTTTYLVGSEMGNTLDINPGIHIYNFSCMLPPMLPTSYEGKHGHIRYTVRVAIERPFKFDQTYKVAFTVLKPLDLNWESPVIRLPSKMENSKTFCCLCCRSGPLYIVASIPQSGFVPGQSIVIDLELSNQSNVPVTETQFTLRQIVHYHSQTPSMKTKVEQEDIVKKFAGGADKLENIRFQQSLVIPPTPPTNISICKVIHITYEVVVEAKTNGLHNSIKIKFPITIGTTPLNAHFPNPTIPMISTGANASAFMSPAEDNIELHEITRTVQTPSAPGPSRLVADNPPRFSTDLPPPSYEQAMIGFRHIEEAEDIHNIGTAPYVPRYPVYNLNPSARAEFSVINELSVNDMMKKQ